MSDTIVSVSQGKVTIENGICKWGLLELPRKLTASEKASGLSATYNAAGEYYVTRAVCTFIDDLYPARSVLLNISPADALAVFMALQGA